MAAVTFTLFEEFSKDLASGVHDLSSDTFKIGLCTAAAAPTAADATPTWSDYSGNEVSGTGYSAGGQAIDNAALAEVGGVSTFDFDDEVFAYNAAGPTNIRYPILYNDTAAGKNAIGFWTFTGDVSMQDGNVTVGPNASGCLTVTV